MTVTMSPKKYAILAGVVLALLLGGYAGGRYAAPDKVVVTEKIVTVHDVQIVKTVDTDAVIAALKEVQQQKDIHKTKVVVKKPDGTVTETTTTDDTSKTETETKVTDNTKTQVATTTNDHTATQVEITKTIERERPAWRLSLQPGLDYPYLLGHTQAGYNLLPSQDMLKYVVVGVAIEHRFVGPLSAGIWANTRGAGGLSLSLEF
jgi:hypothetical protein